MSQTVDIGAARVRLIVDAADFDPIIAQGKNAVRGFGNEAQAAYDRTEKATRRAADSLLDYVNSLGRADTAMDRYVRNASRLGVEKPVLDAAVAAWREKTAAIELDNQALADQASHVKTVQSAWKTFQNEQKQFEDQARASIEAAARARVEEGAAQFARNAQQQFNSQLGVNEQDPRAANARKADAEAAFLPLIERENKALQEQKDLAESIATARQQHIASLAQQDYNKLLGIDAERDALALARRRADAEAAFGLQDSHVNAFKQDQAQRQIVGEQYIKQLQNTEVAAGKTYYELLRLKAAELGVADAAAPIIAKIEAQNAAMGRGTISAKQYALAVRQLPAQFTDVFTSLVAGQNPLLVLLQQGGQVKDMFGGIKTAIGAVAKESAALLTNPYVVLAAVIATVAVAAYQAEARITSLAIATAKGNVTSGTARDLSRFAEQLNELKNINLSSADAAVGKIAESGRLTGVNFKLAAEAAARWATVTGESVDDVASKFDSIARDPMAAMLDGTVKITEAQYNQIRALLELGDKQKAVTELIRIYYDQINKNSQSVIVNLSHTAIAWREVKDAVTSAWHETSNYFDFVTGALLKAREQSDKRPWWTNLIPAGMLTNVISGFSNVEPPAAAAANAAVTAPTTASGGATGKAALALSQEQIKANEDLAKAWDNSGTHAELLKSKVDKLNATLRNATDSALAQRNIQRGPNGTFTGAGYQRLVKALDDKTRQPRQGPDPTKLIQEQERTALNALRNTQLQFDYLYADRETTIESYYARSLFLARDEADVQIKSNNDQIKALTGRRDSEDKIAALRQQNKTVEEQFAAKKAKLDRDEVLAVRERTAALRDYTLALGDSNRQLERSFAQQARSVGRGGRNPEQLNALDNARAEFDRNIRDIQNQVTDKKISPEEAAAKQQAQYDALVEKQRIIQQGYADIKSAEMSWQNGSIKAWEDWQAQVGNIAQQVGGILTSAFQGATTSIVNLISTGKGGAKALLDDLNRQILNFIVKQQLTKFIGSIFGGGGLAGLFGGGGGALGPGIGAGGGGALDKLLFNAHGNAFGGGALSAYRNSVVSQPTIFPFARGGVPNIGVMGERSGKPHEAIMPLTRMAGGNLGVEVKGDGRQKINNFNQTFIVPGVPDRTTRDQLAIRTLGAAQRAARRS